MDSQQEQYHASITVVKDEEDDDDDDSDEEDDEDADFNPDHYVEDDSEDEEAEDFNEHSNGNDDDKIEWTGTLSFDNDILSYNGTISNGGVFMLSSSPTEKLFWDWNSLTATSKSYSGNDRPRMRSISLFGSPSNVDWTLTVVEEEGSCTYSEFDDGSDMDQKISSQSKSSKSTSRQVVTTYGRGNGFELYGKIPSDAMNGFRLICRYRYDETIHVGAFSSTTATVAAKAVATAGSDVEDDVMDADQGVDYDELIALHEDAGMSVADLRKRYAKHPRGHTSPAKRSKRTPSSDYDEGDNDDDIGF
jgi:hypothetical protein